MIPSTKAFVERTGNMLDKLASKMHKTIGRRADMYIEDSESIDMNSCRVMVAYAKHIGPVDSEQLSEFVIREFICTIDNKFKSVASIRNLLKK